MTKTRSNHHDLQLHPCFDRPEPICDCGHTEPSHYFHKPRNILFPKITDCKFCDCTDYNLTYTMTHEGDL